MEILLKEADITGFVDFNAKLLTEAQGPLISIDDILR